MGHLPSLTQPWVPSTRIFVYSVGTADGPDESIRDAFVFDEAPYPERDDLRAVLRDLERKLGRYHLPWERREVARDQVPAELPDWAVYRDRLENGVREYFALLLPGGTTQDPSGLLRRITVPSMSWGQSLGRDGRWRTTEFFHELDRRGSAVGDAVAITPEQARAVVARWQAAGLVPEVDFLTARYESGRPEYFSESELEPKPEPEPEREAGPEQGQEAGTGVGAREQPVTVTEALAFLNRLYNAGLDEEQRSTFTFTEFDHGFVVHRADPPAAEQRYDERGHGLVVIDKATGLLSQWPDLPVGDLVAEYVRLLAEGATLPPVIDPRTGAPYRV